MTLNVQIKKLRNNAQIPVYSTEESAGADIKACIDNEITIKPGDVEIIPTGIAMMLPKGFEASVRPRSGLAAKNHVTVLNTPGTIDSDYRGEVKVILINHGKQTFTIENGMRIAQIVINRHEQARFDENDFDENSTSRATGGFGSTGMK